MVYGKKLNIVIVDYCLCENKWFKRTINQEKLQLILIGKNLHWLSERLHTEKYFRNLIKSNRNQIVLTIF